MTPSVLHAGPSQAGHVRPRGVGHMMRKEWGRAGSDAARSVSRSIGSR
jgi:hypothetical protein